VGDTWAVAPVTLVVTEHTSYLDDARRDGYRRMRARLEDVGGGEVRAVHYADVGTFADAGAVVLSGSSAPWAAHAPNAFRPLREAVDAYDGPVLGICAGMQLLATFAGGTIAPMAARGCEGEHGFLPLDVLDDTDLLHGLPPRATVFQDHLDEITELPRGFRVLARTDASRVQAIAAPERRWWGTQFHPERSDAERPDGDRVLRNFFELAAE
jgi:GMP synthase-like glutamine amidotransferase